jgi:hypothetical protein
MPGLIPGSTKIANLDNPNQQWGQLLDDSGALRLTPQDPQSEAEECCCIVVPVSGCDVCLDPGADCPTGAFPNLLAVAFELSGSNAQGETMSFEGGEMSMQNIGAGFPPSCWWLIPPVPAGTLGQTGVFSYSGTIFVPDPEPCVVNSVPFQLRIPDEGQPCGCVNLGSPFLAEVICVEVSEGAPQEILDCIGGPGLAWRFTMGCTGVGSCNQWLVQCSPGIIDNVGWGWVGYRPFTNSPSSCFNLGGTFCTVNPGLPPGDTRCIPMSGVVITTI